MKTIALLLGGLLGGLLLALVLGFILLRRIETSSITYDSYAEAAHAGALGKDMWLPGDLPNSAIEIRETHDDDTNEVWFTYQSKSAFAPTACTQVAWADVPLPRQSKSPPDFLRELQAVHKLTRAKVYSCQGEEYSYYLAFDLDKGRAYGWSLGG